MGIGGCLRPEADFNDFTQATFDIAGELYGNGGACSASSVRSRRAWSGAS